ASAGRGSTRIPSTEGADERRECAAPAQARDLVAGVDHADRSIAGEMMDPDAAMPALGFGLRQFDLLELARRQTQDLACFERLAIVARRTLREANELVSDPDYAPSHPGMTIVHDHRIELMRSPPTRQGILGMKEMKLARMDADLQAIDIAEQPPQPLMLEDR